MSRILENWIVVYKFGSIYGYLLNVSDSAMNIKHS